MGTIPDQLPWGHFVMQAQYGEEVSLPRGSHRRLVSHSPSEGSTPTGSIRLRLPAFTAWLLIDYFSTTDEPLQTRLDYILKAGLLIFFPPETGFLCIALAVLELTL